MKDDEEAADEDDHGKPAGASASPRRAVSGGEAVSGRYGAGGRGSSMSRSPGPGGDGEGHGGRRADDAARGADTDGSLVSQQIASLAECRSVDEYERLNRVSEGTYGVVFRARCKRTGRICALKKIKMEKERDGFPVTSIREINILLNLHHPNIVNVSEVVMGNRLDQIYMVMEFMDHDLKSLMNDESQMVRSFSVAEVKCLMRQLLSGIHYLHVNWVIHRDLKTSNILYNNHGELKICDFGLARQFGSPLRSYTQPVVTLWYRPPELLLGETLYSTAVDMWSIGCIMAELLTGKPLFPGQGDIEQLDKICNVLGTPNEDVWPGLKKLPHWGKIVLRPQPSQLRQRFTSAFGSGATLTEAGFDLLSRLLAYDPAQRISAEEALDHRCVYASLLMLAIY
ncbi:CDKH1 protein [Gonium pectorale]|uniref:CDKH1 protein n=1 Tax=Gonium pectorale TaxID=33097 RepID=A0A150GWS5_GONPE|nr:CDKH1 protein [Gonium pectorale]|eukprot:KXZ53820.1 CDKH1 protein [Gonium pectorale]